MSVETGLNCPAHHSSGVHNGASKNVFDHIECCLIPSLLDIIEFPERFEKPHSTSSNSAQSTVDSTPQYSPRGQEDPEMVEIDLELTLEQFQQVLHNPNGDSTYYTLKKWFREGKLTADHDLSQFFPNSKLSDKLAENETIAGTPVEKDGQTIVLWKNPENLKIVEVDMEEVTNQRFEICSKFMLSCLEKRTYEETCRNGLFYREDFSKHRDSVLSSYMLSEDQCQELRQMTTPQKLKILIAFERYARSAFRSLAKSYSHTQTITQEQQIEFYRVYWYVYVLRETLCTKIYLPIHKLPQELLPMTEDISILIPVKIPSLEKFEMPQKAHLPLHHLLIPSTPSESLKLPQITPIKSNNYLLHSLLSPHRHLGIITSTFKTNCLIRPILKPQKSQNGKFPKNEEISFKVEELVGIGIVQVEKLMMSKVVLVVSFLLKKFKGKKYAKEVIVMGRR